MAAVSWENQKKTEKTDTGKAKTGKNQKPKVTFVICFPYK